MVILNQTFNAQTTQAVAKLNPTLESASTFAVAISRAFSGAPLSYAAEAKPGVRSDRTLEL